jgi:hypothetical protein
MSGYQFGGYCLSAVMFIVLMVIMVVSRSRRRTRQRFEELFGIPFPDTPDKISSSKNEVLEKISRVRIQLRNALEQEEEFEEGESSFCQQPTQVSALMSRANLSNQLFERRIRLEEKFDEMCQLANGLGFDRETERLGYNPYY